MPRKDTEPYERLISEEEVEPTRPSRKDHQRDQKRGYQGVQHPTMDYGPECPVRDYAPELPEFSHRKRSMFLDYWLKDTVRESRGRRLAITLSLVSLYLILGAAYGQFERFGVSGFARSDVIKSKIEAATKPLEQELIKQTTLLNSVATQLTNQLASSTATQIRSKLERLCAEPKPSKADRDQLNQDIADLQDEYFDLKLMPYTPPPCSQL